MPNKICKKHSFGKVLFFIILFVVWASLKTRPLWVSPSKMKHLSCWGLLLDNVKRRLAKSPLILKWYWLSIPCWSWVCFWRKNSLDVDCFILRPLMLLCRILYSRSRIKIRTSAKSLCVNSKTTRKQDKLYKI